MSLEARLYRWGAWYNYQLQAPLKNLRGAGMWRIKPNQPPAFDEEDIERIDEAYNTLMTINIPMGLLIAHHYRDGISVHRKKLKEAVNALDRLLT